MEFFTAQRLTARVTLIKTATYENLFLIEGDKRALLVDSSEGVVGLKKFVTQLTDKPLTVILTHGHIDHAMGAVEFEEIYMNFKDKSIYEAMSSKKERREYLKVSLPDTQKNWVSKLELTDATKADECFNDLHDGDSFDLRNLTVQTFAAPGHTAGTMVVLIVEEKILISGDAANKSTFVFDENSLPVSQYRQSLLNLNKRLAGKYKRVFISHHELEAPVDLFSRVIEVCDQVLARQTDDQVFHFMGQVAYIAKAVDENFNRLDGGYGNIIYSKERL